jgi:hypothetical protein
MRRQAVLVVCLLMTLFFAFLTVHAVADQGADILTVVSLLVLALFTFGILGALLNRPPGGE